MIRASAALLQHTAFGVVACGILAGGAQTTAQEKRSRTAQACTIEPLVGASIAGQLTSISPSGKVAVTTHEGEQAALDLIDLARIEFGTGSDSNLAAIATPEHAGELRLRSGLVLAVTNLRGNAEGTALICETPIAAEPLNIEIARIASLRFGPALETDGGFAAGHVAPSATADQVYAWASDGGDPRRFSLRVTGIKDDEVLVETSGRVRPLAISRVHGLVFGRDNGFQPDALPKPTVTARGVFPGSPFVARIAGWDGVHAKFQVAEGFELAVPCAALVSLTVDTGRVAFLSDLEPVEAEQTPALNRVKPWLRDRTPGGEGLVLDGTTFRRGLCLIPRTTLTFEVGDGGWDVFEARVGIDDRASDLAHAIIRIRADTRTVFESDPFQVGTPSVQIEVPLEGVQRITIEADFGENLDLGDHCAFADARFRKN